jgi:hypothetical protein
MRQYNDRLDLPGDCVTDGMANAIVMRADIHRTFDECRFVFILKDGMWEPYFLELTYKLGKMHHNTPLEFKPGISAMFLLVRLPGRFSLMQGLSWRLADQSSSGCEKEH